VIEKHICTEGFVDAVEVVQRFGGRSAFVTRGKGHARPGSVALDLADTGNGFIAKFPAKNRTEQDYYLCFDYSQARDLVLALSAFKKDLGFKP
jgi:hypothetical protein